MRYCLGAAVFMLLVGVTQARPDDASSELKKFEGTWILVSGERDGKKIANDDVKKSKITWKGAEVELLTPHQSPQTIKGTSMVDPSKKPSQMDFVRSVGPDSGKVMIGIYEFIDPDQYRICFAPPGKDRPTEFKTKEGSGHTLHVWKRVKN